MPLNELYWDGDVFPSHEQKIQINNYTTGQYLQIKPYINHISSYEPYLPELKKHIFRFKTSFLSAAKEKLSKYGYKNKNSIFVSIHVRLTDYHTVLGDLPGISKEYFSRAMGYFSQKYEVSCLKIYSSYMNTMNLFPLI